MRVWVTVSVSPFHLLRPIVELTAEARLHDRVGAAIIGGLGKLGVTGNRATYWNVGGQVLWYAWGSFDSGFQSASRRRTWGAPASDRSRTSSRAP